MKTRIMVKSPNGNLEEKYIDKGLEPLQNLVEGYIEYAYISDFENEGISIIVNEEGRLINLEPCIAINHNRELVDMYVGNVIFVGTKETEDGRTNDSLSDEQISFITKKLSSNLKCLVNNKLIDVITI